MTPRQRLCAISGHGGFRQRVLVESEVIHYRNGPRDDFGRALSWPECRDCGWWAITMEYPDPEPRTIRTTKPPEAA